MLSGVVSHKWFMGKLDLKDAYLTIPVAPDSWNLLTFQVTQPNSLMQFQCLPFRLCTAPFAFSKVTKPSILFLCQLGIHLIIYLDDLLLAAPTKEQLMVDLSTAIWLLTSLGFVINIPKSIIIPTCQLEFLKITVNTETMSISLPVHKLNPTQKEASRLLLGRVPVKNLAYVIGMLVATKPAVWTGSLHYHSLQDLKIRSLHQSPSNQSSLSLSEEAQADLQWSQLSLPSHYSTSMLKPEANSRCFQVWLGGPSVKKKQRKAGGHQRKPSSHINYLELLAILQSFLRDKTNVAVLVRSNHTAIAYPNKMGSPLRSHCCNKLLQ